MILSVLFFQQIQAEIKDLAGMHFGLLSDLEPEDLWGKKNKLRIRRWQSRGCVKLKQQASNPAQIASHGLHLRLLLLFLLLSSFSPSLSSFCLHSCGFWVSHLLSVCACFEFFFMFPKPLHVTCIGKEKIFYFWIKDGKMFQLLDLWARDVSLATSLYFSR